MQFLHRSIGAGLGLGLLLVLGATPAMAQSADDVSVLAGSCANCHGTDGQSPGLAMVSIGGRPEALLRVQLKAFKSDTPPPGTTIMNRITKGYTDEQLDALAKYYSQLQPKGGK
jgi:cytochrome subunit of sulfide dehydrogenase